MPEALPTDPALLRATPRIRIAVPRDAEAMRLIYNYEVENHTTTTDMVVRSIEDQIAWINARAGAFSAFVAVVDGDAGTSTAAVDAQPGAESIVGFASISPYRDRPAYSTTVENSVYVARAHTGLGIGRALMDHLVVHARNSGFHSMIARIESSGEASIALHRACGFALVGVEREVGRKHRRWLDITIMQLML